MTQSRPLDIAPSSVVIPQPNILIVDDRKENLLATEKVLSKLNAGIFKAMSGNEALSLMLHHRFAVVLLDVQMPEMDGFETATLMQEHELMRSVPIIFVTAISKEERYASQAAEIGAVDYIFKPINPDILRSKVKVYLDLYVQREQILTLNAHLKRTNEELERFAYICSHDLQEPVRMMNIYAGMLAADDINAFDEDSKKYLGVIQRNAEQMRKMIADILAFSRIGREELKIEIIDCNLLVQDILSKLETTIANKKANISCGNLPTLATSQTLLHILFQNIIGNALKFHDGSRPPEITIQGKADGKNWLFSVKDNGIGIDPQFSDKVFAIFQRIHRKEDYSGTGIGLSTCKKFVELCGGSIWYESTPGQGTTFFFTIPQHGGSV
ncbi:MAG: response regulator [Alphaproteobacteria bacterium]|nr:response regulator [Alphaproteobacteria bacterium]MBV8549165.1 response regulator [Alphaproteobacteria bacterium]